MLEIEVKGEIGSGKTTVAKLIENSLKQAGFKVIIIEGLEIEQEDTDNMSMSMIQRNLAMINNNQEIVIKTVNVAREKHN